MANAPIQLKKVTPGDVAAVPTGYVGFVAGSDGKFYAKDGSGAATEIGATNETEVQQLIDESIVSVAKTNVSNTFGGHDQIFDLGTKQMKLYGASDFMTLFHTTDGNSGVLTNGFISIKGSQITEPFDMTIAGHTSYMFGIESDIGAVEPTVVLKTAGPFLRGYNGVNPAWFVEADGSQTIGQSNSSYFNVGRPSAGNSVTTITPGSIASVFNNEAHPRYRLTNNGFEHAIQGDFPASIVGVRFRCSAAGVASIDTNSDFSGYVQSVICDNNSATFRGYIEMREVADPAAPPTNSGRFYFRDNGSGKTQFCVRFPTGAVQVIATEP